MLDFSHLPDRNNVDVQSFFSGAANNTVSDILFDNNIYYFDGAGDYLTVANNAVFGFSTGDFTVEYWINSSSWASGPTVVDLRGSSTANTQWSDNYTTSGAPGMYYNNAQQLVSTIQIPLNTWTHVAYTRQASTIRIFVNGVQSANGTSAFSLQTHGIPKIGTNATIANSFTGYLSNLRIVKGQALYTSTFSPSLSPLTTTSQGAASANVSLLTLQNSTLIDNSTANGGIGFTITRVGDVNILDTIFNNNSYKTGFNGASYLNTPASASYQLTSDFTIEFWFYAILPYTQQGLVNITATTAAGSAGLGMDIDTNNRLGFFVAGNSPITLSTATITGNTWYHMALVRSSTTNTLYLDGVSIATNSTTPTWAATPSIGIGRLYNDNAAIAFNGFISNLRIVNGQALYTGNFTPSTSPLTKIDVGTTGANVASSLTSPVLLLTCQDSGVIDNSNNNFTFTQTGTVTISPVRTTWPSRAIDIPNWHTWIKPRGVNWVYMIGVGGGASGTGGTYSIINSASAQPGGAGGGSGAQTVMMLPAALVPPVLYVHLGQGGRQTALSSASVSVPGGPTYVAIEPLTIGIANNSQLLLLTANGASGTAGGAAMVIDGNFPLAGRAIKVTNTAGQSGTAGGATGAANGTTLILPTTGLMVTGGTGGGGKSINFTSPTSQGGNIAGLPTASSTTNTNMHVGYIPTANGGTSSIANLANGGPGQAGYKFSNWLHLGGTGGGGGGTANTGLGSLGGAGGDGAPGCGGGGSGSGGISTGLPGAGGDGFVHIISF